jgi:hypothetical protein
MKREPNIEAATMACSYLLNVLRKLGVRYDTGTGWTNFINDVGMLQQWDKLYRKIHKL